MSTATVRTILLNCIISLYPYTCIVEYYLNTPSPYVGNNFMVYSHNVYIYDRVMKLYAFTVSYPVFYISFHLNQYLLISKYNIVFL